MKGEQSSQQIEIARVEEREACAQIVEACAGAVALEIDDKPLFFGAVCCSKEAASTIAAAIRARNGSSPTPEK